MNNPIKNCRVQLVVIRNLVFFLASSPYLCKTIPWSKSQDIFNRGSECWRNSLSCSNPKMNYLVVLVAGLILVASPGNSLRCFSCLGSTERCVGDTVNCPGGGQCYLVVAEAAGVKVYGAGCAPPDECNLQPTIAGASVSVSCCSTDLCNASDQVKLSLLLFPALVSVWFAIFM